MTNGNLNTIDFNVHVDKATKPQFKVIKHYLYTFSFVQTTIIEIIS